MKSTIRLCMLSALFVVLLGGAVAVNAESPQMEFGQSYAPFKSAVGVDSFAPPGEIRLRREDQYILLHMPQPGQVQVHIKAIQVASRYTDPVSVQLVSGPEGSLTGVEKVIPVGREDVFTFQATHPGVYWLKVQPGLNSVVVIPGVRNWSILGDERGRISTIFKAGPVYFYVPQGTETFSVRVSGDGVIREDILFRLTQPDGAVYEELLIVGEHTKEDGIEVSVPDGMSGAAWRYEILRPEDSYLEDATVWFSPNIPAGVSLDPSAMLLPQGIVGN